MKKALYIGAIALMLSACQPQTNKNETVITPTPNGIPSASTQNASSTQKPANNPAHGQPFHDCSIPVGAPLVAKQAPASPQMSAPAPVLPEATNPPSAPNKEVKLNPAHGEPGHRCEVAVGAPLS